MDRKIDSVLEKQGYTKCAHCAIDWTEIKATILAEIEKAIEDLKVPYFDDKTLALGNAGLPLEMRRLINRTQVDAMDKQSEFILEKVRELLR